MALGEALELQRLFNSALKHHLLPPTVHTGINVLQAMVNEETSHGTRLQDVPWRLNRLPYTARRHKEFANNLLLDH